MERSSKYALVLVIALVVVLAFIFFSARFDNPDIEVNQTTNNTNVTILAPKYSVQTENVNYYASMNGYLVQPQEPGSYPGIVMIHEWWGLNDNIKEMARQLAAQGYVVLAVDLYGQSTMNMTQARALSSAVSSNPGESLSNLNSAVKYLQNNKNVTEVGSLGWCFGGGQSLQLSLNNSDIDATVIYYGNLVNDTTRLSRLNNTQVLGIFGSNDTSIPVESVEQFEDNLDQLDIQHDIYIYEGVGHAFANPTGMNYAPEETRDAWIKTVEFLDDNLNE